MIPNTIHYCWFSTDKKPALIQRCIRTWRDTMPDFKIKCWDAHSFDFSSVPYVREAFERKKWAFVTDYIRFYAIYKEGGIYLDSDVKVKKNLSPFLNDRMFMGTETFYNEEEGESNINPEPAIFGAEAGHPLIKLIMEYYENRHFVLPDESLDLTVCPMVVGSILEHEYKYVHENKNQILKNEVKIYSTNYFCNLEHPNNPNVYAIHQFANSWIKNQRGLLYTFCKTYGFMPFYRKIEKLRNAKNG